MLTAASAIEVIRRNQKTGVPFSLYVVPELRQHAQSDTLKKETKVVYSD